MLRARRRLLPLLVIASALAAGCTTMVEQGPGRQRTVSQGPGYFTETDQWSTPQMGEDRTYEWFNPTRRADATFTGQVSVGSVTVRVLDAAGAEVWSASANGPGQVSRTGTTDAGEPGTWRIVRETTSVSGQITISLTTT